MKLEILKTVIANSFSGKMTFPQVVGFLMEHGVETYHVDLIRNENRYYHSSGESMVVAVDHKLPKVAEHFSAEEVSATIKKIQQGKIDYPTFLDEVMKSGCAYYIAYLKGRRVIYFGKHGDFHIEHFPK